MLSVIHQAHKIYMAVNYYGRQLSRMLGLAAPAYHKKEGANPLSGARMHNLQYDERFDGCFGVGVWMWNLCSLSRRRGDVCEELRKRMID